MQIMNGTYYEIVGGMSENIVVNVANCKLSDSDAKHKAIDSERVVYKNTYENGKRVKSVCLFDPNHYEFFPVNTETIYYEPLPQNLRFAYSLLDRLRSDCDYVIENGPGAVRYLWGGTVKDHIKKMRDCLNEFTEEEKPEWLTEAQIDKYESKLKAIV